MVTVAVETRQTGTIGVRTQQRCDVYMSAMTPAVSADGGLMDLFTSEQTAGRRTTSSPEVEADLFFLI